MIIHIQRAIVLLTAACVASALYAGGPASSIADGKAANAQLASPDHILARTHSADRDPADLPAVLRANGLEVAAEVRAVPGLRIIRVTDHGNSRSRAARMTGLQRRMEALRATGLFAYVEHNWEVRIQQTPTDSFFVSGELWGLENTGQNGGLAGIDVNAVPAWSIATGDPSVVVAIIDTGIRYTHQDLSGNMWLNPGEIPANGLDDDGNGYIDDVYGINAITGTGNPMDDNDHGTHVAGTVAATAFDTGNHVGVAWDARLMALKFLDSDGRGDVSGAIACIDYAIANGASIINASWGGPGYSQALKDVIDAAGTAGVLFVAAAGNSGINTDTSPFYPAGYDSSNIISVAAIDRDGSRAFFSNYGYGSVDLGAPGADIWSTTASSDSSYASFNGTSMAAPHVSGVAALVADHFSSAGVYELRTALLQSATPLTSLNGLTSTGGMINAEAALLMEEDGDMEFQVASERGALIAGQMNVITVVVTDLYAVTGAIVTGYLDGESPVAFLDDGIAPDAVANDAVYSASLLAPTEPESIDFHVSATAAGKNPSTAVVTFSIINPPDNDNFADRTILPTSETVAYGTNIESTLEPGEPLNPFGAGSHSVWWEWTPDVSGNASVSTSGSDFDTTIALYTGSALGSLSLVAANDDRVGYAGAVNFEAVEGQTYIIQVNDYSYHTGNIQLNYGSFTTGVPNDDFKDRQLLESGTTQIIGTNVGSTEEYPLEPYFYPWEALDSVWYEWIAPSPDPATITTLGSSFDTVIAVYTGDNLTSLVQVAGNDDVSWPDELTSEVTFPPIAGESYKIQVYGNAFSSPTEGTIVLNYPDPAPPAVANDYFSQRILLQPGTTQASGTNVGATLELDEPVNPPTAGAHSVWWQWISPVTGSVTIDTFGSNFDTTLAIYTGDSVGELVLMGSSDDSTGDQSEVTFIAAQGESYSLQVNGSGTATGDIKLNFPSPAYPRPDNDDFANRILLATGTTQDTGTNNGATTETGEVLEPAGAGLHSVWWEWVPPTSALATIDTLRSDFDTTIALFRGNTLDSLTLIASNNDDGGPQSSVSFTPEESARYMIQVNGNGPATGNIVLNYPSPGIPRPLNDDFVDRIVLPAGTIQALGGNDYATAESGEPADVPAGSGQTVWWEWIAPYTGPATFDTFDSSFDTTLAIYTGTELGSLSLIGANDDYVSYYSSVSFSAIAGESYMIQVDGNNEFLGTGLVVLNYPMPGPVAANPGRLRLTGVSGGNAFTSIGLNSVHGSAVNYTVSSPSDWISVVPDAGTVSAGGSVALSVVAGAFPGFSESLETTINIALDHPDVTEISIPVEVVHESYIIEIPDPNLRAALEEHTGRRPGEPLTWLELFILQSFNASSRSIEDLTGIEYAVNLLYLYLNDNSISDIPQLSSIPYLFDLELNGNNLHDISNLTDLGNLIWLDIRNNFLDINPGSDDRAVIDAILGIGASVEYDPQKAGLIELPDWASSYGLKNPDSDPDDINNPLGISNILAFSMGLDPTSISADALPVVDSPAKDLYRFTYYRNLNAIGVTTSTLVSYDLGSWAARIPDSISVIWDSGDGHQKVEAFFEDTSPLLFFQLQAVPQE